MSGSFLLAALLELGSPFGDGMVLQRGRPVPVWGWSDAGASVTVSFAGQAKKAVAGKDGAWRVTLDPMLASGEGRILTVSSSNQTIRQSNDQTVLHDVLVGEVWFASGQSNMDLPLVGDTPRYRDRNGAMLAQVTRMPAVRFMRSEWNWSPTPLARTKRRPVWHVFNPKDLAERYVSPSAVAFYFARELHIALGVPIGLVCAHANGTGIDTWTPREGTAARPDLADLAGWKYRTAEEWPKEWNAFPMQSPVQQPAAMWNASVNPIAPFSMRGVIWYQGCHNYSESGRYVSKMHALVDGWRLKFENPELRFYYAQLAACFETVAQAQAQYEREGTNVAMAVTCDTCNPDDIHPNDKETVGRRLALKALKRDYGISEIEDSSPVVRAAWADGDRAVLEFDHAKVLYVYNPDRSLSNDFELCGEDGKWVRAEIANPRALPNETKPTFKYDGVIDGTTLVLRAPGVSAPRRIRHHIELPFHSALYNEVNLPLGPLVRQLDLKGAQE